MCGEKWHGRCQGKALLGSPPRVRGKALASIRLRSLPGITPACAGKSTGKHSSPIIARDHPRVCGEKTTSSSTVWPVWGSPPRVRGKAAITARRVPAARITPACAGKRLLRQLRHITSQDHPRVCGEKAAYLRAVWVPKGSPPRVRGKAKGTDGGDPLMGITPACAGKSMHRATRNTGEEDHPRVCGEKSK